jgi:hypothetical protein
MQGHGHIVACFRQFGPCVLPIVKRWLADSYSSNWATTDSLCGSLLTLSFWRIRSCVSRHFVDRPATCGCAVHRRCRCCIWQGVESR